jgi:tRNA(fMet)-specific endonuclease VapC
MVIDTSLFIEHIRAKDKLSTTLYSLSDEPNLFITSISVYELYMGAKTKEKQQELHHLTGHLPVLPFTE